MNRVRAISGPAGRVFFILLSLCLSSLAYADNARDWQNVPKDINIVFGYYVNANTDTSLDTGLAADGISVNADIYMLRYARSFDIAGRSSGIQIIQPYARMKASLDGAHFLQGDHVKEDAGDIQFIFVHNLYGAPAVSAEEFRKLKPAPFVTGAMWVSAPTGQYDKHRALNIGTNRWSFKPELASGYPLGPVWLELNTWITFFTDNDDYQGDKTLSKRSQYAAEGHISYNFNPALWVSLDSTWSQGGETEVNGDPQDNEQQSTLLGGTLGFQLSPQFGGLVAYTDTVAHRSNTADASTWTFRLQYVW